MGEIKDVAAGPLAMLSVLDHLAADRLIAPIHEETVIIIGFLGEPCSVSQCNASRDTVNAHKLKLNEK